MDVAKQSTQALDQHEAAIHVHDTVEAVEDMTVTHIAKGTLLSIAGICVDSQGNTLLFSHLKEEKYNSAAFRKTEPLTDPNEINAYELIMSTLRPRIQNSCTDERWTCPDFTSLVPTIADALIRFMHSQPPTNADDRYSWKGGAYNNLVPEITHILERIILPEYFTGYSAMRGYMILDWVRSLQDPLWVYLTHRTSTQSQQS